MSLPVPRLVPLLIGLASLLVWTVLAMLTPAAAFRGWLIGFIFVASLCAGSLALVLIQRLVGGRWGSAFAPELEPAARVTPILLLFVLPVLFGLPLIYPWAAAPGSLEPGVHALYLNAPFFVLRTAVGLIGWSALAVWLPRIEGPRGRLGAGLGLAFYGLSIAVLSTDWLLSVQPSWTSSDIGMDLATQQIGLGCAFAALQARRRVRDPVAGDLAGLMFATIIGLTYLEFMSYLVVWYGEKPSLNTWYIARVAWPWRLLPWTSLAFAVAAMAILAGRRAVGAHRAVAWAGGCVIAGVLSYQLWLLAPGLGAACLLPAAFALIGQGGVWLALATGAPRIVSERGGLVHAA